MKQTVYIASPESQQIHVWNLNHEGALTLTQVVDVPGQVQPMVVSRTNVTSTLVSVQVSCSGVSYCTG